MSKAMRITACGSSYRNVLALVLALVAGMGSSASVSATEAGWVLAKDKDGVKIYAREVKGSAIREIRAITHMPFSASTVAGILADPASRQQWLPNCSKATLYKAISADEQIVHYSLKLPWPVEARDAVVSFKWNRESVPAGGFTILGTAVPNLIPPQRGHVRIVQTTERWDVTPDKSGGVTVQLTSHAEPGGPIPAWLINSMSIDMPLGALANLKNMASKSRPGSAPQ